MPTYQGPGFKIDLPDNYADESTYAFTFPASGNFRPSVVVKTDILRFPLALTDYAFEQRTKIGKMLPGFEIVHVTPGSHGEYSAVTCVYDWGDAARRVRQLQRHILLPDPARVVTLTATALREMFAQTEALFDAVFDSYRCEDAAAGL
jgi:hypothetical protein